MEEKELCPYCNTKNVIKDKIELENEEEIYSYLCIKCGFTTNDTYTTQDMIKNINNVSQLILDLSLYEEQKGLHWFPIILISTFGSIYPEGSKDDWHWIFTPIVPISEEERKEYGEEFNTRFAVELSEKIDNLKFLDACKKMGMVAPDLEIE